MAEVIIVGTSHISKQSVTEVKTVINTVHPDIVAVELDKRRFHALMSGEKREKFKFSFKAIRSVGFKGFIFQLIGAYAEKKLGDSVGISPGDEMIAAINSANKIGSKIALIDRDISITLKRLNFGFKDGWVLFKDFFRGLFFRKKEVERLGLQNFDLSKVPEEELIEKMINEVKVKYPGIYTSLIHERNIFMANQLIGICSLHPDAKIVAVMGAGHKKEVEKLLTKDI